MAAAPDPPGRRDGDGAQPLAAAAAEVALWSPPNRTTVTDSLMSSVVYADEMR